MIIKLTHYKAALILAWFVIVRVHREGYRERWRLLQMTNAAFQPPKLYLVMWDINISFQYNFSYLASASFLLFPLLKIAADRQVFIAGAVWQAHPAPPGPIPAFCGCLSLCRLYWAPWAAPVPGCALLGAAGKLCPRTGPTTDTPRGSVPGLPPPWACSLFSLTRVSRSPLFVSFGHWICLGAKVWVHYLREVGFVYPCGIL